MIAIAEKTVHVRSVHHVRAHRLRIEFTDGVLQWNDFDLVFPMADLYDGVIR